MIYCNLLIIALVSLAPGVEAQTVGWRTDGGGNYLDADIPIAWSASENVIWKTPMPAWSNASPVVVGDRLYVLGEQTLLLCLDRASGQILWQASNHYQEVLDAPALWT